MYCIMGYCKGRGTVTVHSPPVTDRLLHANLCVIQVVGRRPNPQTLPAWTVMQPRQSHACKIKTPVLCMNLMRDATTTVGYVFSE